MWQKWKEVDEPLPINGTLSPGTQIFYKSSLFYIKSCASLRNLQKMVDLFNDADQLLMTDLSIIDERSINY